MEGIHGAFQRAISRLTGLENRRTCWRLSFSTYTFHLLECMVLYVLINIVGDGKFKLRKNNNKNQTVQNP